jgi:exodeoxyribonuclease VII small subunit
MIKDNTSSSSSKRSYNQMKAELDIIMQKLQDDSLDIDEALKLYEKGHILVESMEKYLEKAQNTIKKIKTNPSAKKSL